MGTVTDVLRDAAERLLDRLDDTVQRFTQALDVGGRGVVAPLLRARGIDVVSCDLSPAMAALNGGAAVAADEEFLPFAGETFDLVVASLSLHWVNDLPGALIQLRLALRPGGLLLASLPALGTLAELRQALTEAEAALTGGAAPRVSPFVELRDCAALLQRAGFALPVADVEDLRLLYADPFALLRELRAAGRRMRCASATGGCRPGRCSGGAGQTSGGRGPYGGDAADRDHDWLGGVMPRVYAEPHGSAEDQFQCPGSVDDAKSKSRVPDLGPHGVR